MPPAVIAEETQEKDVARRKSLTEAQSQDARSSLDIDAIKLAEMGYTQDMKRNFSVWSVLGVGFSLTNSWFGISASMVTGISSGGPMLIVYGIIIIAIVSAFVGITLSELVSALPNAGGQYYWASQLAPKKYARLSSFLTGWFAWTGAIFTSASSCLSLGIAVVGCWQLGHPDFTWKTWHVFVGYQVINCFAFLFNCYGRTLPWIATTTLYISLISFTVILITVPATAPTHQPAKFVFATFINASGWNHAGIAFIIGLINTNWPFACLDCATHLAEEVQRPERVIPIAIMGTVTIGFVTSWFFSIAMFFSIVGDFASIQTSVTGVPILQLFYQALNSTAGAIVLEILILMTGIGCLIASHAWQSRLCWSFARDKGLPFSTFLAKVDPKLEVPLRAHFVSCFITAAVGCLYLGSYTAFNSMVTACITLLYISYAIPTVCLLIKGRNNISHGPFWLGPIGLLANIVLLCWTVFTVIMYSFPYTKPVTAGNMNYISAVYGVVVVIIALDWFLRGRRQYQGAAERHDFVTAIVVEEERRKRTSIVDVVSQSPSL